MKGIREFPNFYTAIEEIPRPLVHLVLVLVPFHQPKAMATRAHSIVQWKHTNKTVGAKNSILTPYVLCSGYLIITLWTEHSLMVEVQKVSSWSAHLPGLFHPKGSASPALRLFHNVNQHTLSRDGSGE